MPRRKASERRTWALTLGRLALFAACAWASSTLLADEPQPTVEQCASVADDAERLACFDRAVRPQAPPPVSEAPEAAPADQAEQAAETEHAAPSVESLPPAIPDQAVQEQTEERQAPPAEAERRGLFRRLFRDRGQRETRAEAPASASDDAIESNAIAAKVVRVVKLMRGNFQLVLDNGETWRENEYQPGTSYEVGDAVRIRERFLGMHDLTNQRTRQVVRVSRVR